MKNYRIIKVSNMKLENGYFPAEVEVVSSFKSDSPEKANATFAAALRNTTMKSGEQMKLVVDREVNGCVVSDNILVTPITA